MSGLIRSFEHDFEALVKKHGCETAVIVPAEIDPLHITYDRLNELVERCLVFYQEKGLKSGDVIFSLMPNAAETVVCFLAAIAGGYGFAPLPCIASRREIDRWIGLIGPKLCVTTSLITRDGENTMKESGIPTTFIDSDGNFNWLPAYSVNSAKSGAKAAGARVYLSTSGTTGEPKAMVLDANTLWSSGVAFMKFHDLKDAQLRFWNYLPMSYLGGLFNLALIPLSTGGSLVIDETFSGKTFLQFWQTVERFDINAIWFVPTIARGLLSMAERTPANIARGYGSKLKATFIGTAPIDLETKKKLEQTFGLKTFENFALSETTFFTTETADNYEVREEGSAGEILPYADVKLVSLEDSDATDAEAPKQVFVRSPFLFKGYLQADGTLALNLDSEGYFATGDLGELTANNILRITGRFKDFIKKGGYLVALREVEVLAEQHPAVHEAAAVKVKHGFYGESFDLYVTLAPGFDDGALGEIVPYVHKGLIKYKWPERILSIKEFPKTLGGKIQKHLITQMVQEVKA